MHPLLWVVAILFVLYFAIAPIQGWLGVENSLARVMRYAKEVSTTRRRTSSALSNELRIGVMRLSRRLRAERSDEAMTLNQLSVMSTLANHGAMTIGELASHEKVQPPSMTRTVACLEESGHVAREQHPTDRRQVVVELTPAGHDRVDADRERSDAWLDKRLRELTAEERDRLRAAAPLLSKLASA